MLLEDWNEGVPVVKSKGILEVNITQGDDPLQLHDPLFNVLQLQTIVLPTSVVADEALRE
jgi:hypothetical protein